MQRLIKTIAFTLAFSSQLFADDTKSKDTKEATAYKGAFDTFYKYIETLNKNELTDENIKKLFNVNFCFSGSPNLILSDHAEIKTFYNSIRNGIYPKICHPHKFSALKLHKLAYLPMTERFVKIALLDVFLTTPNETPRYKMSFIYSLVYDDKKESWLMNALEEVQVKNYPNNWKQLEVRKQFKYDKKVPISELKPLLASEIEP